MATKKPEAGIRCISWKQIATIIGTISILSGMIMTLVAWLHADVLIPKILHHTAAQIDAAIDDHERHPHAGAVRSAELRLIEGGVREAVENVDDAVQEFKSDTKKRFDRIEEKLDQM